MHFIVSILQYFFAPLPPEPFQYKFIFLGIAGALLIASILTHLYLKKSKDDKILKKLFRTLPKKFLLLATCEALYVLFRYERMSFFSVRIINYIILAATLYVIIKNIRIYQKEYPKLKKEREEQMRLNQYLPRKKTKK